MIYFPMGKHVSQSARPRLLDISAVRREEMKPPFWSV